MRPSPKNCKFSFPFPSLSWFQNIYPCLYYFPCVCHGYTSTEWRYCYEGWCRYQCPLETCMICIKPWNTQKNWSRQWIKNSKTQAGQAMRNKTFMGIALMKSINQSISQSINQSISQSINQSIYISIYQYINISISYIVYIYIYICVYTYTYACAWRRLWH